MAGVSIRNFTRRPAVGERRVFSEIAKTVLPGWDISLVFVGETRAKALNRKLRGKTYVPNVLSYVVGEKNAEIIICPTVAEQQAPNFQLSTTDYLSLLFIHGALHIKGWAHSVRMERCEQDLLALFNETTPLHRCRRRHAPGKSGRR